MPHLPSSVFLLPERPRVCCWRTQGLFHGSPERATRVRQAGRGREYVEIRIDIADGCSRILSATLVAGAFPARDRQETSGLLMKTTMNMHSTNRCLLQLTVGTCAAVLLIGCDGESPKRKYQQVVKVMAARTVTMASDLAFLGTNYEDITVVGSVKTVYRAVDAQGRSEVAGIMYEGPDQSDFRGTLAFPVANGCFYPVSACKDTHTVRLYKIGSGHSLYVGYRADGSAGEVALFRSGPMQPSGK